MMKNSTSSECVSLRSPKFLPVVALLFGLLGCSPTARLQELAHPHVDCSEEQVAISGAEGTNQAVTYMASCPSGREYRCNSIGRPYGRKPITTCEETDYSKSQSQQQTKRQSKTKTPVAHKGQWFTAELPECHVSVQFPEEPTDADMPEDVRDIIVKALSASLDDRSFSATCARRDDLTSENRDEILDAGVKRMATNVNGTVVMEKPIKGFLGRSVVVELPRKQGQILGRIYVQEKHIFVAMALPRQNIHADDIVHFFKSIQFDN